MSDSTPLPPPKRVGLAWQTYTADDVRAIRDAAVAEAVQREREPWAATVDSAIEALEWHASNYCEDSMPQATVDALDMLRKAAAAIRATPAQTPDTERTAP